jgi:polyisoprenoid-binding protein YceI
MSVVENARNQLVSSGLWSVDPVLSTVEFRVEHMMIQTVRGRFRDFDGAIVAGDEPSVSGSIRVASLKTLN